MEPAPTGRRQDGTFKPGISGNPRGRVKGSKNKATRIAESLLDGEAKALTRKAIELALGGDVVALRMCLERIMPRRERTVSFALPKVTTPKDAASALAAIMQAIGSGDLTPTEAKQLASLVEVAVKSLEAVDHEKRISFLEERDGKNH